MAYTKHIISYSLSSNQTHPNLSFIKVHQNVIPPSMEYALVTTMNPSKKKLLWLKYCNWNCLVAQFPTIGLQDPNVSLGRLGIRVQVHQTQTYVDFIFIFMSQVEKACELLSTNFIHFYLPIFINFVSKIMLFEYF